MCPNLRHYTSIYQKGMTKSMQNVSQDKPSPGQDLNPGPPKHEEYVWIYIP
jgi:hypothetical protein